METASTPELIDLASLRYDFSSAKVFAQSYLSQDFELLGPELGESDALWLAALTLYGRAFANGLRHRGRAYTDGLSTDMQEAHDYFIDTRNKFVAHSVNAFEIGTVFVDLNPRDEAPGVSRIGEVHASVTRLSREMVERLSALCEHQVRTLTRRIEVLHQVIGQELLTMGEDAVYSLPAFTPPVPDGSNPRSART
ncbi:hypothetical protein IF188_13535 [Microbacterium sp. NEAU-LLC]|uniref:Uncharacterized protein n=1 Tax=Microbacterium helvum TaxID=2773713 RepID=A0ABR8NRC2_9MICO|nr:hypothetical protein [Microbacterium helvum]MBD3942719.1 hypothetical protein [Microbacterium helvum]